MTGVPKLWTVYDANQEFQASCKGIEAAAVLMGFYGDGASIRFGHGKVVWREGKEAIPAGESYDQVYDTAMARLGVVK